MLETSSYRLVLFTALTLVLSACYVSGEATNNEIVAIKMNGTGVNAAGERAVMDLAVSSQSCPGEDYSPCTCTTSSAGFQVSCIKAPFGKVKDVLSRSTTRVLDLLYIFTSDFYIPENMTGGVSIRKLEIMARSDGRPMLRCSPNAFTSTEAYTKSFRLMGWNLREHHYTYLENFTSLNQLWVSSSVGFFDSWHRLPPLPTLTLLDILSCERMGDLNEFPPELPSLRKLAFMNELLDDTTVASILDWLLLTPSLSLTRVDFSGNLLTVIPSPLSSFPTLREFHVSDNYFNQIPAGAFNFHPYAPIERLGVSNCRVKVIEPGAFVGDFRNAEVVLKDNPDLSRFEEAVFKEILLQMKGQSGFVDLASNLIDCDTDVCHLEWLIVTNPELLKSIHNGRCSNGTRFQDLDATTIWRACPKELTSTEPTSQQTTSAVITAVVTTPIMTEETAEETTETEMTTRPSQHVSTSYYYSTTWPTMMTTKEAPENVTSSHFSSSTSTMANENMTTVFDKATSYMMQKPSASSIAQHSTVLLLVSWMLIVAIGA